MSLFCGSCAVESKIVGFDKIICNDKQPYLIALLKAVQNGYEPPDSITEEQYQYIKSHKDDDPALTGFCGFACSFGGKFFGGYARGKNRDFARVGKTSLLGTMETMATAVFLCTDYREVDLPQGCVIYADPPYANTTGYSCGKFDSNLFWDYAREVSRSHLMFISEQTAPDDFVSIWEKQVRRTLDVNKQNQPLKTEKLFVHECQYAQLSRSSQ